MTDPCSCSLSHEWFGEELESFESGDEETVPGERSKLPCGNLDTGRMKRADAELACGAQALLARVDDELDGSGSQWSL